MVKKECLVQFLPAAILILTLIGMYFYFGSYLNVESFKEHHQTLKEWLLNHFILGSFIFILSYLCIVAASVPGASLATLIGGYLFGLWVGTFYVVLSATLGALLVFLLVEHFLSAWTEKRLESRMRAFEEGFNRDVMSYLLFLRLVPLFPFWLVNIASALLKVPFHTFCLSTFLGIIPGSFIYVSMGNALQNVAGQKDFNMNIVFSPEVFLPLLGLGLLALLPIIYKMIYRRKS